jgi:hypothetical protein
MTIPSIGPVPPVPSRSTQSRRDFVIATDSFFIGFPTLRDEMNASIDAINDTAVTISVSAQTAIDAANRAEAAGAYRTSIAFKTWAELAGVAGATLGQTASVFDDAGTHTDPVAGGSVDNEGIYRWSVSPAGWEWVSDGLTTSVAWGDISGKPGSFTPSAHTHAISDVTGLTAALSGKAANGLATGSGLTATTGKLLGRSTAGTGALEEIGLGTGLSFDGTTLTLSGGGMSYPASGIAVSTGAGWGDSLTKPNGNLVGTTASQSLTNKTLGEGTVLAGGTINGGATVSDSGTISVSSVGFRGLPPITATTRTLDITDMGKIVVATGNVTVPTGLPVGFVCSIYNNSSSAKSILGASGVTLRLAGSASTGTRSLAQRGLAAVVVVNTNEVAVGGVT